MKQALKLCYNLCPTVDRVPLKEWEHQHLCAERQNPESARMPKTYWHGHTADQKRRGKTRRSARTVAGPNHYFWIHPVQVKIRTSNETTTIISSWESPQRMLHLIGTGWIKRSLQDAQTQWFLFSLTMIMLVKLAESECRVLQSSSGTRQPPSEPS